MKAIFITLTAQLDLMIIPDTQAHLDGHSIITRTYSIYKDKHTKKDEQVKQKESGLLLENKSDTDYLGMLTFDVPDKLFTYTAGGNDVLNTRQVEETIEIISHYRDSPSLWHILPDEY